MDRGNNIGESEGCGTRLFIQNIFRIKYDLD